MTAPTLVIGVGGTGIRVLLRVKERFLEAYDRVPDNVVLYEIDTDDYKLPREEDRDEFNGVRLTCEGDRPTQGQPAGPAESEFYHVTTRQAEATLDTILNRTEPYWRWVNRDRLNQTIVRPGDRVIVVGARTVRPVGRGALFLDYDAVYQQVQNRLRDIAGRQRRVLQEKEGEIAEEVPAEDKAVVFVVASTAGGSGAGMTIDILRMIEHMRDQIDMKSAPISVMALLVGGGAFTHERGERIDSNTYALLRELDRLGAVVGRPLSKAVPPVMWAPPPVNQFKSELGPADMILLFDRPDRNGHERNVRRDERDAYLEQVIAPSLADLILIFADERIAPKARTVLADFPDKFLRIDPRNPDRVGYFPYSSAGNHTLIFPERDVRKSAGFRLLGELWDNYLVRQGGPADGKDLEPSTRELWGENRSSGSKPLTPFIFTDEGFVRDPVCKGATNNNFINTVVTSSLADRLQLPAKSRYLGIFGSKSMMERVFFLVGLPSKVSQSKRLDLTKIAARLERDIDRSIETIDRCKNVNEARQWRTDHFGEGAFGSEKGGLWEQWCLASESITGHRDDYKVVVLNAVVAILNDADANRRTLPYRLEYAERALNRLEQHVLRMIQGDPDNPEAGSLLSDYFSSQIADEAQARQKVKRLEAPAARGERFASFVHESKAYAKARKELLGMRLLEILCEYLLEAVRATQGLLRGWQSYLLEVRDGLAQERARHEANRIVKSKIPVRTYLVDRPTGGFLADSDFELGLYTQHRDQAINAFREAVAWTPNGGTLDLQAPFGKEPAEELKPIELVKRAVAWACTSSGNPDRPQVVPPLRDLASPREVKMAERIMDMYDPQTLTNMLTTDSNLASLCPLKDWPRPRLMYVLGLPRTTTLEKGVPYYQEVVDRINGQTAAPRFNDREIRAFDPENPRHAVAAEFSAGFRLEHRRDYDGYEKTYRKDTDRHFALHCMPEEDQASTYFELEFKRESPIYPGLGLNPFPLDPAVVDVLGERSRLDLFIKALAVGVIERLPEGLQKEEGVDFYLWPEKNKENRLRLSKMRTTEDIRRLAQELTPLASQLTEVMSQEILINRLRLMYALRTFVLLEHDVDDEGHRIPYEELAAEIDAKIGKKSIDERTKFYGKWWERFLEYYKDHKKQNPVLAHLGLVLARLAYDLRATELSQKVETGSLP